MRRNMSGNLGLYKYLWPGSVCEMKTFIHNEYIITRFKAVGFLCNYCFYSVWGFDTLWWGMLKPIITSLEIDFLPKGVLKLIILPGTICGNTICWT